MKDCRDGVIPAISSPPCSDVHAMGKLGSRRMQVTIHAHVEGRGWCVCVRACECMFVVEYKYSWRTQKCEQSTCTDSFVEPM